MSLYCSGIANVTYSNQICFFGFNLWESVITAIGLLILVIIIWKYKNFRKLEAKK